MKHVGANIKHLRLKRGWNQGEVAKSLKISIPAVSKIESGDTDINLSRLADLMSLFSVSFAEILNDPGEGKVDNNVEEFSRLNKLLIEREKEISMLQKQVIELFIELRSPLRV